jgi:hypothetical protein
VISTLRLRWRTSQHHDAEWVGLDVTVNDEMREHLKTLAAAATKGGVKTEVLERREAWVET